MTEFKAVEVVWRGEHFEIVRYGNGHGRVYHLPSERIAVDNTHLLAGPSELAAALDQWLTSTTERTGRP